MVQLCYICKYNHPQEPEECGPSYSDCARCEQPTCKKHGRSRNDEKFYCIRCLRVLGYAA